jgi:hypothetical protein
MIRLPTSEEEEAHMGETFPEDNFDEIPDAHNFHDEDDDIPPPVVSSNRKVKMTESEGDFFDVSDGEEEEVAKPAAQDEGTKAWRD